MGIFRKLKDGISSRANGAIDRATDPAKEIDIAIMELEEGRKKALEELIAYKSTSKVMEQDITRYEEKAAGWEKKAMMAVRAGEDEAAKLALKEKKNCLVELEKIKRDRDEAAGHAISLNKSRKEFEVKLQILKLRKGTLATQLAAARSANGDAFGHDREVWDKFERAEQRIDEEVIETEVDAALRGEEALLESAIDRKVLAAGREVGGAGSADDALEQLKAKMAEAKAKKEEARRLAALPEGGGDKEGS